MDTDEVHNGSNGREEDLKYGGAGNPAFALISICRQDWTLYSEKAPNLEEENHEK